MSQLFDHEKLKVYQEAIELVAWHEQIAPDKKNNLSAFDHFARASAGIPVNVAQASGKRSMNDRRQFVDTAYGSSLECAACLDVLLVHGSLRETTVRDGKRRLSSIVSMLIGFRKSTVSMVRESRPAYVTARAEDAEVWFDHERLDVYRKSLEFVSFCSRFGDECDIPRPIITTLDRASTSVVLNIAEGNGKFSTKDRCRFISHARTASLQAAANLDVCAARSLIREQTIDDGKRQLVDIVRMLVAWERHLEQRVEDT